MERRAAGEDAEYAQVVVSTIIATATAAAATSDGSSAQGLHTVLADWSCLLPARGGAPAEVVIGTLDLNHCAKLPAEELIGREPPLSSIAVVKRAYLSNVCVLDSALTRRQGVAQALIREAERKAKAAGVSCLYVHVVAHNTPARCLYEARCGFSLEQEETEGMARALNRPRRQLLLRRLTVPNHVT